LPPKSSPGSASSAPRDHRHRLSVRGLTTAATLWIVAAIGRSCGAGFRVAALLATLLVLVRFGPLRYVERSRPDYHTIRVAVGKNLSTGEVVGRRGRSRSPPGCRPPRSGGRFAAAP
jgi:hypothetical protein